MPLRASSVARIREIVNPAYEEEVSDLVRGRHRWKASRDLFEATAKIVSGFASVAAFTASSIPITDNGDTVKWVAFGAGCLGTLSLTLLLFANYSAKESRERTSELNALLRVAVETNSIQHAESSSISMAQRRAPFEASSRHV